MANAEGKLVGVESMLGALREIDENIANKWLRTALRSGAKVIQSACVASAPRESGLVKSSVKVRSGKRTRTGYSMNVILSAKSFPKGGFYVGFIDRGHKTGSRKSKDRKQIPGTFWLEAAFDGTATTAQETIEGTLAQGLAEETAKAAAKAQKV